MINCRENFNNTSSGQTSKLRFMQPNSLGPRTENMPQTNQSYAIPGPSYSKMIIRNSDQNLGKWSSKSQKPSANQSYAVSGPSTSKMIIQNSDQNLGNWGSKGQKSSYNESTSRYTLGLMGMPNIYSKSQKTIQDSSQNIDSRLKMKKSGETELEKLYILTGTVERVIKYGKIFQNHFCYFQVIGSVVSIADGKVQFEKVMLLRDKKGPILQLIYYSNATHINIEDFHLGKNLRAVGRMVGPNIMSAITIRAAAEEEVDILPRLCYISDYAVSALCGDKPK